MITAVNLIGVLLIAAIVWWFWLSKPRAKQIQSDVVEILVDNGVYSPARIEVKAGQSLRLSFLRKDPSPCAEKVFFESLGISHDLALNERTEIKLDKVLPGEYEFTCQMQMYRGSLIVR